MASNPIQPLITDAYGVVRFKENKLVRHLLDWASERGMSLNELALVENIARDDREQFAQLIGYSLSGYGELSYVGDATYEAALRMAETGESPLVLLERERCAKLCEEVGKQEYEEAVSPFKHDWIDSWSLRCAAAIRKG